MKKALAIVLFAAIAAAVLTPWQKVRGQTATNAQLAVLTSAARTAAQVNSADITNIAYRCAHIVVTVSAYTSGSYTPTLQGKNVTTGSYYDVLVGTAITATGQTVLKVCPGLSGSVSGAANDFLPQTWRVQLNGLNTPNMTIAVDALLAGG